MFVPKDLIDKLTLIVSWNKIDEYLLYVFEK